MKKLLGMSALFFFITSFSAQANECLEEYRQKDIRKNERYKHSLDRFHQRRKNAQSAILSSGGRVTASSIIGSSFIQNTPVPKKEDFNMFEHEILKALDYNGQSYKPKLLETIYNKAYSDYSDVTTYEKVQSLILKGFEEKKFCSFWGNYNGDRVTKYVLKELKKESSNSAVVRDPAVIDSSYNYKEDIDFQQEVENPTENIIRGVDE